MKKFLAVLCVAAVCTSVLVAAPKKSKVKGVKIGVSMPTKDLQRWNQDGANMKAQLQKAGYKVDLQYAANDIPTQVSQIENMLGYKITIVPEETK